MAAIVFAVDSYMLNNSAMTFPRASPVATKTTAQSATRPVQSSESFNMPWYVRRQIGEIVGDFTITSIQPATTDNEGNYGSVLFTGTTTVRGTYYVLDGVLAGPMFDVDFADKNKIPLIVPSDNRLAFMFANSDATEKALGSTTQELKIQIANFQEHFLPKESVNEADFVGVVR